jgi:hypothetical protein
MIVEIPELLDVYQRCTDQSGVMQAEPGSTDSALGDLTDRPQRRIIRYSALPASTYSSMVAGDGVLPFHEDVSAVRLHDRSIDS